MRKWVGCNAVTARERYAGSLAQSRQPSRREWGSHDTVDVTAFTDNQI